MKNVLLLGASGSIGTQTLDVLKKYNNYTFDLTQIKEDKDLSNIITNDMPCFNQNNYFENNRQSDFVDYLRNEKSKYDWDKMTAQFYLLMDRL